MVVEGSNFGAGDDKERKWGRGQRVERLLQLEGKGTQTFAVRVAAAADVDSNDGPAEGAPAVDSIVVGDAAAELAPPVADAAAAAVAAASSEERPGTAVAVAPIASRSKAFERNSPLLGELVVEENHRSWGQ